MILLTIEGRGVVRRNRGGGGEWGGGGVWIGGIFWSHSFIMTSASTNLVWGFLYCSAQLKEQQKGHRNKSFYMPLGFKNWVWVGKWENDTTFLGTTSHSIRLMFSSLSPQQTYNSDTSLVPDCGNKTRIWSQWKTAFQEPLCQGCWHHSVIRKPFFNFTCTP